MKIKCAKVSFNHEGTPISEKFDDVYFSNESGIEETLYVFIRSNQLIERWKNTTSTHFTIAETGFGTGLNFLVTLNTFLMFKRENPNHCFKKLYFLSTEKFPIAKSKLELILDRINAFKDLQTLLLDKYPCISAGQHRMTFADESVTLDLYFGDAAQSLTDIHAEYDGLVNAWFLDGFAPSKNSSMWTTTLFNEIARLSKPGATFGTFTSAGIVKRGLSNVGFCVKKVKGFGRKREMLLGTYQASKTAQQTFQNQHPAYYRFDALRKQNIAIIGGGIASACLAVQLVKRGLNVSLICKDHELASGASGNLIGGFYPQLNAQPGIHSQIQFHSFLYAIQFYESLKKSGFNFDHSWSGVLQLAFNETQTRRIQKLVENGMWPESVITYVTESQANEIAKLNVGHDGLFIPNAGWISPPSLVAACIEYCLASDQLFQLHLNTHLKNYNKFEGGVKLDLSQNGLLRTEVFDAIVMATGDQTEQIITQMMPFRNTRGQVEFLKSSSNSAQLACVICHKGYMTPQLNGYHAMGSSYIKEASNTNVSKEETNANINMHLNSLNHQAWLKEICDSHQRTPEVERNTRFARASIRCSTPDHLPLVGAEPEISLQTQKYADLYKAYPSFNYPLPHENNHIFYLTALGSRGLTTAPMMAEVLASQITNEPLPLPNRLLDALNPNRFLIRSLIRKMSYLQE